MLCNDLTVFSAACPFCTHCACCNCKVCNGMSWISTSNQVTLSGGEKRVTRFERATFSLATRCSTTELYPHIKGLFLSIQLVERVSSFSQLCNTAARACSDLAAATWFALEYWLCCGLCLLGLQTLAEGHHPAQTIWRT